MSIGILNELPWLIFSLHSHRLQNSQRESSEFSLK